MNRFYVGKVTGSAVVISDKEQLHHLRNVLRLKVNDEISLSDGLGNDYAGVIKSIEKKQADIEVTLVRAARENPVKLSVACAIPKNTRFDDVVDFLTQLGVERIIPMRTERVVVRLDSAAALEKHKRWLKIAQNAAQQSRRSRVPGIGNVIDYNDVISGSTCYDTKLIPHLSGERRLVKDVLAESHPKDILVLIGPEGDFTPEEIKLALDNGFQPVSLGDTVLRVATAAIAVASFIKFAAGD
jgi:16S rRNA (uracil1498-N3)-methyltransferase